MNCVTETRETSVHARTAESDRTAATLPPHSAALLDTNVNKQDCGQVMALLLLIAGSVVGTIAALVQWIALDLSLGTAVTTYFLFGFGLPVCVGLAKWIETRLRAAFDLQPVMRIRNMDI